MAPARYGVITCRVDPGLWRRGLSPASSAKASHRAGPVTAPSHRRMPDQLYSGPGPLQHSVTSVTVTMTVTSVTVSHRHIYRRSIALVGSIELRDR